MILLKDLIKDIKARQVLTSRGSPTVEVEFVLDGFSLFSSVPSGKSTGSLEAKNLVDSHGSVEKVVQNIYNHKKMLMFLEITKPDIFDAFLITLDGTKDKSNLGANFILPISICYRKLLAYLNRISLSKIIRLETVGRHNCNSSMPFIKKNENLNFDLLMPLVHFNVINGGLHSGNNLDCQEIMVCFPENSFKKQLEKAVNFFNFLGVEITEKYGKIYTSVGDEGGYVPPVNTVEESLDLIMSSARRADISNFKIALDLAANSFYHPQDNNDPDEEDSSSHFYFFENKKMTGLELANLYEKLIQKYPIYSIEDPFAETDFESWKYFSRTVNINVVADDLTVTNVELIEKYGNLGMFNTVLIKPNQIGSVSEAIEAVNLSKKMGFKTMVSHRSSETEDTFIANFAVGTGSEYFKAGAPQHGERLNKYNELLRIEEDLINEQSY